MLNIVYFFLTIGAISFGIAIVLGEVFYNDFVKNFHLVDLILGMSSGALLSALAFWLYGKINREEGFY